MTAEDRVYRAQRRAGQKLANRISKATAKQTLAGIPELDEDPDDDDPCNLWLLSDGRLSWRTQDGTVRRTSGSTGGSSSSGATPEDDPDIEEHTAVYPATWARTFCALHGIETGPTLAYGDAPQHDGCQVMVGFNTATITTDLNAATIQQVELRVLNAEALDDQVTLHFGTHTATSAPGDFQADRLDIWDDDWPQVGYGGDDDGYHTIDGNWLGRALQNGTATGLVIVQPSGPINGGRIDWTTLTLAITYTT